MSSEDINNIFDSAASKQLFATTVKLNGNYLLWAQSFHLFVGSQKKLKHLAEDPPAKGTSAYDHWVASDFSVMTWLINKYG